MANYKQKSFFFEKFNRLFSSFSKIIVVKIDNIGSNQLQKCRIALRKTSVFVFGKNTIMKKVLKYQKQKNPALEGLLPYLTGNIGLIFTKMDPDEVKKILNDNKIPAQAKIGQAAQCDVTIPRGPTNLPPDGTSFFQALNIPTKIEKGQIEIENPVKIIVKGQVVGNSEFVLMQKLNIVPFSYEIQMILIYDNEFYYEPFVLDISESYLKKRTENIVLDLSKISYEIGYPTIDFLKKSIKKTLANLFRICYSINYDLGRHSVFNIQSETNKNTMEEMSTNIKEFLPEEVSKISNESQDFGFGLFD
mmetsp:Transcript_50266/g.119534  ORF Transcript_50266/g.119534 Transcript_50266/m.119534 type:complete len:305 (+) Transcript_50266:27-941(+)